MTRYPLLGSEEFFAACREADKYITAGDGKKPVMPKSTMPRIKADHIRPAVPTHVRERVINLKMTRPKMGKSEIQATVFRETGVYFSPSLVSQWWCAHKKKQEVKRVKQKTRQTQGEAGKDAA